MRYENGWDELEDALMEPEHADLTRSQARDVIDILMELGWSPPKDPA